MLYTAKCYWPGISSGELERAAARALREAGSSTFRRRAAYLGAILFPNDELVLCVFEATSGTAVKRVSERAGIPCERIMETAWLPSPNVGRALASERGDAGR